MKKLYIGLLIVMGVSIQAATVRIKNESSSPVWARINDKMRSGVTEFWAKKRNIAELAALAPALTGVGLIVVPLTLAAYQLYVAPKRYFLRAVPNFRKIKPGKSLYFDSGMSKIKKITFLTPTTYTKVTVPKNKIVSAIDPLTKTYGNIVAFKGEQKMKDKKGPAEAIVIQDEYSGKPQVIPYQAGTAEKQVTINVPKLETFSIEPNIGALTVEAKIVYKGWGNAKRK